MLRFSSTKQLESYSSFEAYIFNRLRELSTQPGKYGVDEYFTKAYNSVVTDVFFRGYGIFKHFRDFRSKHVNVEDTPRSSFFNGRVSFQRFPYPGIGSYSNYS